MIEGAHAVRQGSGWCILCGSASRGPFSTEPQLLNTWEDQLASRTESEGGQRHIETRVRLCKWDADGAIIWTRDVYDVFDDGQKQYKRSLFLDPTH